MSFFLNSVHEKSKCRPQCTFQIGLQVSLITNISKSNLLIPCVICIEIVTKRRHAHPHPNLSKVTTGQRKGKIVLVSITDAIVFMHYQRVSQDYLQLTIGGSY